jgi:hypothetical protein
LDYPTQNATIATAAGYELHEQALKRHSGFVAPIKDDLVIQAGRSTVIAK